MLFTIELRSGVLRFRLQKDGAWRECLTAAGLAENDFTASTPEEARGRMTLAGQTITMNGKTYDVDSHTWPSENEGLHYDSLAFRREYPARPQRSQLVAAIAAGDGSVMSTLLLRVDGVFELRQTPPYNNADPDPSIVVWHGAQTGDYVGLDASEDDEFIDRLFLTSMHCWLEHLQRRETQQYANDDCSKMRLADVEVALQEIETSWRPAY